jgi:hypothetical protein
LIPDTIIHDKFNHKPILSTDFDNPFIPCTPVFKNIDDLLSTHYPHLSQQEYIYHKQRLQRNRSKLFQLRELLNRQ